MGSPDRGNNANRPNRTQRVIRIAAAVLPALAALAPMLFGIDPAWASTDTTFQGPLDTVSGIVAGTGGQLAAALAVGAALVGSVLPPRVWTSSAHVI